MADRYDVVLTSCGFTRMVDKPTHSIYYLPVKDVLGVAVKIPKPDGKWYALDTYDFSMAEGDDIKDLKEFMTIKGFGADKKDKKDQKP